MKTLLTLALLGCVIAAQAQTPVGSATAMRAKHDALQPQLRQNPFQKPIHLVSSEASGAVSGDIFAVVAAPFGEAAPALAQPESWCEILLLQFNVKLCRAAAQGEGAALEVSIARKPEQPADQAYKVAFNYRVEERAADYLRVRLHADKGPVSTRDYRILLEASPLADGRTFVHLFYAYGFGGAGKLAMQFYLGGSGADKVGFTPVGGGQDQLVGGMRGVIERNTMRYYLAIEALLGALGSPRPARFEKAARDFHAGTVRYKRQLYEMEQGPYLDMKRREYQAQVQGQPQSQARR
jgi:hypothetical protein